MRESYIEANHQPAKSERLTISVERRFLRPLYANLPNTKNFAVERSFMRHTFQVSFTNHIGNKRKYMFSVDDEDTKTEWLTSLSDRVEKTKLAREVMIRKSVILSVKTKLAAEAVALKTLQDSLIAVEEENSHENKRNAPILKENKSPGDRKTSVSVRYKITPSLGATGQPTLAPPVMVRQHSHLSQRSQLSQLSHILEGSDTTDTEDSTAQTGKDIVLMCRQNSLLPVILGFFQVASGGEEEVLG